tara:strand:- start:4092 stop:7070 length:2979 start_codon:yes stop_codon:yes gene_type:complete
MGKIVDRMNLIDEIKSSLDKESANLFQHALVKKRFKIGEKIVLEDELPNGIYFVINGRLRFTGFDDKEDLITLHNYGPGDVAGLVQLARGFSIGGLSAACATDCFFLPLFDNKVLFLELLKLNCLKKYLSADPWEIMDILINNFFKRNNISVDHSYDSFRNDFNELIDDLKIVAMDSDELISEDIDRSFYMISGANCSNYQVGELLVADRAICPTSDLPVRLVKFPNPDGESFEDLLGSLMKSKIENTNLNYIDNNSLQIEALEDWYGQIRDDGTFPHIQGKGIIDESMACLRMLARIYDMPFRKDVIKKILNNQVNSTNGKPITYQVYAAILDMMGLKTIELQPDTEQLFSRLPYPALAFLNSTPIVLWSYANKKVTVSDPREGLQSTIPISSLLNSKENESSIVLCVEKSRSTPKKRFGLSWFLPAIEKNKSSLTQVVITSFFVQLLGVFNPLLVQQIIDAVISQGNYSSLNVLGTLLIAMAVAQALLGSLRTYLFSDTTNRIDISLGASIINHMLRLPLGYFARRPVGEISSRISELEKIRGFLTGTALTVILDVIFSFVYIAVMLLYSVPLTLAALSVVPLFVILTAVVSPIIRKQIRERAESSARVQSHLVETLTGIETVKGQGMELPSVWRWEQLYDNQIVAGFKNTITSTAAGSTNQFLGQLSGLVILWYGASLVLEGNLTLGQLIAFRILSGYVTTPILRLSSLWQNFQETALSLERLGDIVDHPEEIEISGENLPPIPEIEGKIQYSNLSFRFGTSGALQLSNINFTVEPGQFVGIVGSSGSGKSTLLKLITKLYEPNEGNIRIDNYDISKVDLYSLRSQIGVVPQDSLLFDGTVQANVSLTKPDATFEEVVDAAKLACADDFIETLPSGYSSSVGERGSALSGGQRQRLAIARMILKNPNLLILDEATSALDVDTEKRLIKNLSDAYSKKTVLFITHRIASMIHADKILVMHQSNLVEEGTHEELIALGGRYATLYKQQEVS